MAKRYLALLLAVLLLLAGCSAKDSEKVKDNRRVVGIFLPDTRWETEGQQITKPLTAAGYRVELNYANGDPQVQHMQLQTLLSGPVDLVILCPLDSMALSDLLQEIKEENIPVLSYDRMVMYSDAISGCVAIDTYTAGRELGKYILDSVQPDTRETAATAELLMGSPEDNNAYLFHAGLMSILAPYWESGKLTSPSARTSFDDTCVQNADPHTARSYFLDYLLDHYLEDQLPDILCTGGAGMIQQCADLFPEDPEQHPLNVGIGETDSTEPFSAYACFDRNTLAKTCVDWALKLLENPESLPNDTLQNNGVTDVPTFLLAPQIVK